MNQKNNLLNKDDMILERYLREKDEQVKQKKIEFLLELVRNNPDITEKMIRPDLRKYLGIVKREYKKEISISENKKL